MMKPISTLITLAMLIVPAINERRWHGVCLFGEMRGAAGGALGNKQRYRRFDVASWHIDTICRAATPSDIHGGQHFINNDISASQIIDNGDARNEYAEQHVRLAAGYFWRDYFTCIKRAKPRANASHEHGLILMHHRLAALCADDMADRRAATSLHLR